MHRRLFPSGAEHGREDFVLAARLHRDKPSLLECMSALVIVD
jgi:hypothetical protein